MTEPPTHSNGEGTREEYSRYSNIPIPDPSVRTTENLRREIATLRELLITQIQTLGKELDSFRLNHEEKHREVVDAAVSHVAEMADQRAQSFEAELKATDRRYEQRYEAQSEALKAAFFSAETATKAALAAAEKAVTTALASSELGVQRATEASDKAIAKAETQALRQMNELEKQIDRRILTEERERDQIIQSLTSASYKAEEVTEKRFVTITESINKFTSLTTQIQRVDEAISGLSRVLEEKITTVKTLIEASNEKIAIASSAAKEAVQVAQVANEKRFEVNTGQMAALAERTRESITKVEFDAVRSSLAAQMTAISVTLTDKIEDLRKSRDLSQGRQTATPTTSSQISSLADQVQALRDFKESSTGGKLNVDRNYGYVIGAVGMAATIISVVIVIVNLATR